MRHRLFIPAATALLFALAACTQDELAGDNRLPEGEYPVVIRATGLSVEATPLAAPSTRAAVDGDWQGITSVALKMGDAVKEYTVTASTDYSFTASPILSAGIHRNGFYGFQECHTLTRERSVLLDQPRPDYRIGMVALQQCRHHTDACREGGRRPKQTG